MVGDEQIERASQALEDVVDTSRLVNIDVVQISFRVIPNENNVLAFLVSTGCLVGLGLTTLTHLIDFREQPIGLTESLTKIGVLLLSLLLCETENRPCKI